MNTGIFTGRIADAAVKNMKLKKRKPAGELVDIWNHVSNHHPPPYDIHETDIQSCSISSGHEEWRSCLCVDLLESTAGIG